MTTSISDLVTDDAPATQTLDGQEMAGTATFSPDRVYRYALTRTWNPEQPPILWIMCNPSTADAFQLDPTLKRVRDFSHRWGYGSFTVLNVFALRSPYPTDLTTHPAPVGPLNDEVITAELDGLIDACDGTETYPRVMVGWGVWGGLLSRGNAVRHMILDAGLTPHCLAQTADGSPMHPLARGKHYIPADTRPQPWGGYRGNHGDAVAGRSDR